jgi:chorismate synthase
MPLRLSTAGESHGPKLVAILEGIPAGLALDREAVAREMARRQHGYGRGGRMKIENDEAIFVGGVRGGLTLGSPIGIEIANRDFESWSAALDPWDVDLDRAREKALTRPRPGHADLSGGQKYGHSDLRNVLERASARESAARVAAGAVCRSLLSACGIEIRSGVLSIAEVDCSAERSFAALEKVDDRSPLRALDTSAETSMIRRIDQAKAAGETVGGSILVGARNVPAGLGSHVSWHRKLDGRIAQALLSVPAVKALEFGTAIEASRGTGSSAHDEILPGGRRRTNRAGGLEGGITNGEDLIVVAYMKPISTLAKGLASIDLESGEPARSAYERSDVTAVPACGVICEAMLAFVLADALLEVTGGDRMEDVLARLRSHRSRVARFTRGRRAAGSTGSDAR